MTLFRLLFWIATALWDAKLVSINTKATELVKSFAVCTSCMYPGLAGWAKTIESLSHSIHTRTHAPHPRFQLLCGSLVPQCHFGTGVAHTRPCATENQALPGHGTNPSVVVVPSRQATCSLDALVVLGEYYVDATQYLGYN